VRKLAHTAGPDAVQTMGLQMWWLMTLWGHGFRLYP